jgi:hypothetical protein
LVAVAAAVFACSRNINNKEAVRQGIMDYLNKRSAQTGLDMKLMNVDVTSVQFRNNEARALVSFVPKDSPRGGMSMNYTLERSGNHWVVKGRAESGMSPHAAQGTPPSTGSIAPIPPGQPQALPPGHPPVGSTPQSR